MRLLLILAFSSVLISIVSSIGPLSDPNCKAILSKINSEFQKIIKFTKTEVCAKCRVPFKAVIKNKDWFFKNVVGYIDKWLVKNDLKPPEPLEPIARTLFDECLEKDPKFSKMSDVCKTNEDDVADIQACLAMKLIGKIIPLSAWAPQACKKVLPTDFIDGLAKSKTVKWKQKIRSLVKTQKICIPKK